MTGSGTSSRSDTPRLVETGAIRFVGPLYGRDRFAAYADADVFCLTPRHWEETSVAALEAAALGTAVVVTEQTDIPGIATSGGGFVVKLDPAAIRCAVVAALESPRMGELASAHVRGQHAKSRWSSASRSSSREPG